MPARPRLLLCDAVAIITAHEVGTWLQLCASCQVLIPSIVMGEAHFYYDDTRRRIPIDLRADAETGRISEYVAPVEDFAATAAMLHPELRVRVDDGEREALTYLRRNPEDDIWFVTADGGAIEAAVAFDRGDCAQSLDAVLRSIGITKRLPRHHTDAFIREHRRLGGIRLIEGRGLIGR